MVWRGRCSLHSIYIITSMDKVFVPSASVMKEVRVAGPDQESTLNLGIVQTSS